MSSERGPTTPWPDDANALLAQLWAEGLSARQIAMEITARTKFTVTRNAVIGRRMRMNLPMRGKTRSARAERHSAQTVQRIARVRRNSAERAQRTAPTPVIVEILDNAIGSFQAEDVQPNTCRYIFGDPKQLHRYCGRPGEPWCPAHKALVFKPATEARHERRDNSISQPRRARTGSERFGDFAAL